MSIRTLSFVACLALCCEVAVADEKPVKQPVKKPVAVKVKKAVAIQLNAVQVKVVDKKALEAQKKAVQEYTEAVKAVRDLTTKLQEVQKSADAAEGEADKAEAIKKLNEVKNKLEKAKKDQAVKQQAVKKFAAQAAVRRIYVPPTQNVRKTVDPLDAVERFVLLNPGGPLVVEVSTKVNGEPFRVAREKLIDELLKAADKDGDGKPTWKEAIANSRFTLGRIRITNQQQTDAYLKALDTNKNKIVDRAEVRAFLAMYFQGPAFALVGQTGYYRGGRLAGAVFITAGGVYNRGGQADVRKLLDKDEDGVLSKEEIDGATERLKSRDADDNDLLVPGEINGTAVRGVQNRAVRVTTTARAAQSPTAVILGPTASAQIVFTALHAAYKNKEGHISADRFTHDAELFKTLDSNSNGKIEQGEVLALNKVEPHVRLSVALGKTDKGVAPLKVESVAKGLKHTSKGNSAGINLEGVAVSFTASTAQPRTYDYQRTADSYLTRFDKDKNGYLDKKEMTGNYAYLLQMWDANEDGKVFGKEIVASYNRMQAPQRTQVKASAANHGNSLFSALDVSKDGRLSLREMQTAKDRIREFDKNKDQKIQQTEIPVTVAVTFGLGNAAVNYSRPQQPAKPGNSDAPEWFTHMDRNGDGDITLKEFIGDREAFEKLDTNNDGFIEPKEAKAVSQKKEAKGADKAKEE